MAERLSDEAWLARACRRADRLLASRHGPAAPDRALNLGPGRLSARQMQDLLEAIDPDGEIDSGELRPGRFFARPDHGLVSTGAGMAIIAVNVIGFNRLQAGGYFQGHRRVFGMALDENIVAGVLLAMCAIGAWQLAAGLSRLRDRLYWRDDLKREDALPPHRRALTLRRLLDYRRGSVPDGRPSTQ